MAFADLSDQFAESLLAEMGVSAIFTPAAGDPVTLMVSYQEEVFLQPGALTSEVYAPAKTIEFHLSDLGRKPVEGETFTIGSTVYKVASILSTDDEFFCKCEVTG